MKKVIRSIFMLILVLSLSIVIVPSASAASKLEQTKSTVYRYLTNTIGLNRASACGIMANIEQESNFDPTDVIVDSNGRLSGGLFQWNGSRFTNLKNYCRDNGYDYLSVKGQMSYLKKELNTSSYKSILNHMKGVSNNAEGSYDAGYYWCYYFERPANKSSRSVSRGNLAKKYYANFTPSTVTLSTPKITLGDKDAKINLMDNINLSWTDGGIDCTSYIVEIAKKTKNGYDWKKATSAVSKSKKFAIFAYDFGPGSYAARVSSKCEGSSTKKTSSVVKFTISCVNHIYNSKITKAATTKESGNRTYTCSICNSKLSQTLKAGKIGDTKLATPTVSATLNKNGVATVKCSGSKGADGYTVYLEAGGVYFRVAVVPSGKTVKLPDMFSGNKLKVVAFKTVGPKTVKSPGKVIKLK